MKTSTMFLLAGAAGVGYYLYKKQQAPVTIAVPVAVPVPVSTPAATSGYFGYFGDDATTGTPITTPELPTDTDGNAVVVDSYVDDSDGSAVPYGWGPSWGTVTGGWRRGGGGGHGHGGGRGGHR
jgi:hypothetical protein